MSVIEAISQKYPSVSIIIPSYNSGLLLPESIESCLKQSYKPSEIIVVNDGSEDNTDGVISAFRGRIRYVKQGNQGVARARNRGAEMATGDWLLFLDADDILYPHALSHLAECAAGSPHGVIFGITRQYRNGELIKRYNKIIEGPPPQPARGNFLKSLIVTPGAAMVKAEIFKRANGFKSTLAPSEDRHFWLKCGVMTSFKACDKDVVLKRQQKNSASNDRNRMIYKGLMAQLDFIIWCYENKIDFSFLPWNETQIYEMNLKTAVRENCWASLQAILLQARFSRVTSMKIRRYNVLLSLSPLTDLFFVFRRCLGKIS